MNNIPEITFLNILNGAFDFIRKDFANEDEEDTFLKRLFEELSLQRYSYFDESKHIFIENEKETDPKFIQANIGWNLERINKRNPTVHILLKSDNPKDDSLGLGNGNIEPHQFDNGNTEEFHQRTYRQTCQFMITSDNTNDTIMLYYLIRSLLTAFIIDMGCQGIRNVSFSGSDLQMNQEIADKINIRNLDLSFDYEFNTPSMIRKELFTEICFDGKPKIN